MTCCTVNMKNATPDYLLMVIHLFLKTALETLEQTGYFSVIANSCHYEAAPSNNEPGQCAFRETPNEREKLFVLFFLNGAVRTG